MVGKSGSKFDPGKAKWYNHQYLQLKTDNELAELFLPYLDKELADSSPFRSNITYISNVVRLIKERATFVKDFWNLASFFFEAPGSYDAKASKKQWKESTPQLMKDLISLLNTIDNFSAKQLETIVKDWITNQELGFGKIMPPFRLALVGALKGPDLFEIASLIGKEETIQRLENAIEKL